MRQSVFNAFPQELNMGRNSSLPPPLRPNTRNTDSDEDEFRGSLSDFSEYESSGEEAHNKNTQNAASSSNDRPGRRAYQGAPDLDVRTKKGLSDEDDPFADPFGDSHGVDDSSTIRDGRQRVW